MYSIFTYIWAICGVNVGKYSIHGAYGILYKSYDIVIYKLYRLYGLWMFRKHLTSKQLFITIVNGNYKSTNITGGCTSCTFIHMRNIKLDVFEAWLHEKTVFRVTNSVAMGSFSEPGEPGEPGTSSSKDDKRTASKTYGILMGGSGSQHPKSPRFGVEIAKICKCERDQFPQPSGNEL